jgi:uncharacterized protein YjbK
MKHEVETELKMLLKSEDVQKLLAGSFKDIPFIHQLNTYYRSNNHTHYAFRIRQKNGESLFTLKEHRNGEVVEHEKILSCPLEKDEELLNLLASFNEYPPYEVLGQLSTLRADLITDKAVISLDINFYNGKKDFEIEYEVNKPHDHEAEFRRFLNKHGIEFKPNHRSKYKRFLKSLKEEH